MRTLMIASNGRATSAMTRHSMVHRVLLACGFLSSLTYVAATNFGAMVWQGYSSVSKPVSELSAIGAPSRLLMTVLGLLYVFLVIAFGLGVWACSNGNRALRIVAGLLIAYGVVCLTAPLTPMHQRGLEWTLTDTLHIVSAAVDILFILLILAFGAFAFGNRFRLYSFGTILVGVLSGVLMGLDRARFGIWERLNIYGFLLWVAVLAIVLLRSELK